MNEHIKVSIIMSSYKEAKYIKKAIESVFSQTFLNWELIIIDDGLYDEPKNEINLYLKKDKRIILLKNEKNLGIQRSANRGLKKAKGEYIARIDDDDEWISKDKLQKQVEFLDKNKDYVLVGTGVIVVNEEEKELYRCLLPEGDIKIRKNILLKNCFINSSVLFRKNVVLNMGGYNEEESVKHVEDYDLFIRLGIIGKLHNIPEYLTSYTMRKDSISGENKKNQFKRNIKLIKKYKSKYKGYVLVVLFGYLRLFLYKIFELIPITSIKYKILRIYKKF